MHKGHLLKTSRTGLRRAWFLRVDCDEDFVSNYRKSEGILCLATWELETNIMGGATCLFPDLLLNRSLLGRCVLGGSWRSIFMREDKVWERNIFHILEQDTCHTGTMSCYWNEVPFLILQTEDVGCNGRHSFWQWRYVPWMGFSRKVGKGIGMNTGKTPLETLKKYCSEEFCNRSLSHEVQRETTRSLNLINCYE